MTTKEPVPGRVLIHVKAELRDLIPIFLEYRRKDICRLGECFGAERF